MRHSIAFQCACETRTDQIVARSANLSARNNDTGSEGSSNCPSSLASCMEHPSNEKDLGVAFSVAIELTLSITGAFGADPAALLNYEK
jgi:hypothetical protein